MSLLGTEQWCHVIMFEDKCINPCGITVVLETCQAMCDKDLGPLNVLKISASFEKKKPNHIPMSDGNYATQKGLKLLPPLAYLFKTKKEKENDKTKRLNYI